MHCSLRPPESRQPARFNYDAMRSLKSLNLSIAVLLLIHYFTLYLDLWPWTFAVYRLWRDETPYQIWMQSSHPRRSYCDFSVWPYDLEHCITRCARLWDNFHQVWPSTTYPCLNYGVLCWYVMSRCDLDLWPLDLELLQHFGCHALKLITKFERNRIIHRWGIDDLARFRRAI